MQSDDELGYSNITMAHDEPTPWIMNAQIIVSHHLVSTKLIEEQASTIQAQFFVIPH